MNERIETAIASSKNADVEKFSVAIPVQKPILHRVFEGQVAHAVGEQIGPGSVGARGTEQGFDLGKKAHEVDARQAGHFLIVAVVGVRHWKAEDLPQRGPAESQDRCVGPWLPGGGEELPVKRSARDRIFEGVVETMYKDEEIAAGVGQVACHVRGKGALVRILNGSDRPRLIGLDIHAVHKGRGIDNVGRYRRRLDIGTIACDDSRVTGEDAVTREKHGRWYWSGPLLGE